LTLAFAKEKNSAFPHSAKSLEAKSASQPEEKKNKIKKNAKKKKKALQKTKLKKENRHPLSYSNPAIVGPFFEAALLYAKPALPNFLPAKVNLNADPTNLKQKEERPAFNWEVGWLAGLGINLNHAHMDLTAYWTSLSGKASQTLESTDYGIQTYIHFDETDLGVPVMVNYALAYSKFHLNSVDLELGKSLYAGAFFALRPALGVRWVLLEEEFFAFAKNALNAESFPKYLQLPYRYHGVGLSFSLKNNFHFTRHFCFIADGAAALLYGQTKSTQITVQDVGHLDQEKKTQENGCGWFLKPYVKIFAGFACGGTFYHKEGRDRLFLGSRLGYFFEGYFDLNSSISTLNSINSTLEISGFLASLRFEF
jgi:hypothetical protein